MVPKSPAPWPRAWVANWRPKRWRDEAREGRAHQLLLVLREPAGQRAEAAVDGDPVHRPHDALGGQARVNPPELVPALPLGDDGGQDLAGLSACAMKSCVSRLGGRT